jgi:two-component system response regulator HydG
MTSLQPITMDSVVVGKSARMRAVFEFLRVIGNSESTVLITGESGTGKEVMATLIHQTSRRKHHPFVAVSCALFTETLIESELFGHERGAFTGAIKDRPGRFELADAGTIFLDDIDDVPVSMQVKLLRVLQNRTIERLGGTRTVPVNVRVIAGSKRDLRQLVAEGKFREDLFYRLNVLPLTLPPLRERREDITPLMDHFLERYFRRRNEDVPAVSESVRQAFTRYNWPGNVRELENAIERAVLVAKSPEVQPQDLPDSIRGDAAPEDTFTVPPHHTLAEIERMAVVQTLQRTNWNKQEAAQILGLYRPTLYSKMKKHEIKDQRAAARASAAATPTAS